MLIWQIAHWQIWLLNRKINTIKSKTTEVHSADLGNTSSLKNQVRVISDKVINENMRSLNMQQREIFNFVNKWSGDYIKSLGCKYVKMLNYFICLLGAERVLASHNWQHPYVIK